MCRAGQNRDDPYCAPCINKAPHLLLATESWNSRGIRATPLLLMLQSRGPRTIPDPTTWESPLSRRAATRETGPSRFTDTGQFSTGARQTKMLRTKFHAHEFKYKAVNNYLTKSTSSSCIDRVSHLIVLSRRKWFKFYSENDRVMDNSWTFGTLITFFFITFRSFFHNIYDLCAKPVSSIHAAQASGIKCKCRNMFFFSSNHFRNINWHVGRNALQRLIFLSWSIYA